MELGVRDWMIIIGGLLILAVLLDGYRRMRRGSGVRMALAELPDGDATDDDISTLRELPNGGARVVERRDLLSRASGEDMAAESVDVPLATGMSAQRGESLDLLAGIDAGTEERVPSRREPPPDFPEEIVMLHVVARNSAGFAGEDILHILLACDMRFGEMDFFHRHEQVAGRGPIQFSVANMMQPGVFDIDGMSEFTTPGLTFFLRLPGPEDMMQAFNAMLETAQCVADNLEGDLLDESRSVATRQTVEHIRQRIRELERRMLTHSGR